MTNPQQLISKLWNYCNIAASLPSLRASLTSCLRDDGLSYGVDWEDCHEQ